MRIVLVTHRYPPHTGGVETHVQEIAKRLVDRGHNVIVFSADADEDIPVESSDEGVRVRRFRSLSPGGAFYVAPQMVFAVRRADADVVHAHNYHAFPLFFAALGVTDERFVVTTHYHGESASGLRDRLLSLYRPLGRWAVQKADEVIAVSEWERERLYDDFGIDATVIPNGVDVERFAEAEPEERERPYLLCVGRLEEYKGVQHVIRALTELPGYELLIAGSGPYRGELERVARETDVENRVKFLGHVDDEQLLGLYAGADVYVTLSSFESFGMTVAEALTAGTPCVVRKCAALRDWTSEASVEGVANVTPSAVAAAVSASSSRDSSLDAVETWPTVAERIFERYTTARRSL
jgi:glycosyltransferase involved in cell wall biosynthesis